ncbi:MAG: hypothetical protein IJ809_00300 [Clostridia bacterium]|nr:hypothetical protein [Clostridia bacterium]
MGLLDLFKPKKQRKVIMRQVYLKNIKKDLNELYIGKICNIVEDTNKHDEPVYRLTTYEGNVVGNFKDADYELCEKYNYAAIYSMDNNSISVCILCANLYPISLKIEIYTNLENGTALLIQADGSLFNPDTKSNVGKIIDDRLSTIKVDDVAISQIDNDRLLTLFYK